MRPHFPSIALILLALAGTATRLDAQPHEIPLISVGAALAVSCPGSNDGIPTLDLACSRSQEGAPGPYVRPYVSLRPFDRLLVTTTVGYLRMPRVEQTVYDDGTRPPVTLVVEPRTAWHVHATAAYVGGRPTQPARAFVGGGLAWFRDPARQELRGTGPDRPVPFIDEKSAGIEGVFTAGVLLRLRHGLGGRVTYTLAEQLATTTLSDGGWRHEVAVGLEWGPRRR
ncbi:MAG TPA: hypothetical protein VMF13_04555 [Luteitalea sp.]|nr:hypothetical protein [Luteitalea sp.]